MKKYETVTETRFRKMFFPINHSDKFRLTHVLSNKSEVEFDTGYCFPSRKGWVTFYEQAEDNHGICMKQTFRAKNYQELKDYLLKNNESWRLEDDRI